ncbi:hypothetical protein HOY82DRAFT_538386 [Tuber indicum]|nr:hypothetical protein HOY82DRAFT_538386 [Tuber indicum]
MVGRRRIAATWAIGEAWSRFSREKEDVVRRAFRVVGLALPIDGSADIEISIKGIETDFLLQGLVNCQLEEGNTLRDGDEMFGTVGEVLEDLAADSDEEVEDDTGIFFD